MKEIGKKDKKKERAYIIIIMEINMMEIGKIIQKMEKEYIT